MSRGEEAGGVACAADATVLGGSKADEHRLPRTQEPHRATAKL